MTLQGSDNLAPASCNVNPGSERPFYTPPPPICTHESAINCQVPHHVQPYQLYEKLIVAMYLRVADKTGN
jgi:hypothetical protein